MVYDRRGREEEGGVEICNVGTIVER